MKLTSPKWYLKVLFSSSFFSQLYPSLINLSKAKFTWNITDKTSTFTCIPPNLTVLTMLEAIRTSRDSMVDQLLGHIITYLRRRGTFGGSGKEMRQLLFCRNVEYGRVCFEGFMKSGRSIQRLFWLKGMKTVLNGRTFKYHFCVR